MHILVGPQPQAHGHHLSSASCALPTLAAVLHNFDVLTPSLAQLCPSSALCVSLQLYTLPACNEILPAINYINLKKTKKKAKKEIGEQAVSYCCI